MMEKPIDEACAWKRKQEKEKEGEREREMKKWAVLVPLLIIFVATELVAEKHQHRAIRWSEDENPQSQRSSKEESWLLRSSEFLEVWVSPTEGSDADGCGSSLNATACQTLPFALDQMIPFISNLTASMTIHLTPGTYTFAPDSPL